MLGTHGPADELGHVAQGCCQGVERRKAGVREPQATAAFDIHFSGTVDQYLAHAGIVETRRYRCEQVSHGLLEGLLRDHAGSSATISRVGSSDGYRCSAESSCARRLNQARTSAAWRPWGASWR